MQIFPPVAWFWVLSDILFSASRQAHDDMCRAVLDEIKELGSERYNGSNYIHSCSHYCYWRSIWDGRYIDGQASTQPI
jgi:hypothetical protein